MYKVQKFTLPMVRPLPMLESVVFMALCVLHQPPNDHLIDLDAILR